MKNFFKNAIVYRLTDGLTADAVRAVVDEHQHSEPGSLDPSRYGFVAPFGASLVEEVSGAFLVACKYSWRDLPGAVIKRAVRDKVLQISEAECRPVGRAERQTIKDEVTFDLLPKAFVRDRTTYAMVVGEYIIVDAVSAKQAEDLLSKLREALGSLKCLPVGTANIPSQVMTHMVQESSPGDRIEFGDSCVLVDPKSGGKVRCNKRDLESAEIRNHVASGMTVEKISLAVADVASFDINEKLHISRIKFDDLIDDKVNDGNPETKLQQDTATLIIYADELKKLLNLVFARFGGVAEYEPNSESVA